MINGLYQAEFIHRHGRWRPLEAVKYATLEWGDRFTHRRLSEPIGNIRQPKLKILSYAMLNEARRAA